jgi:hypothetical protein
LRRELQRLTVKIQHIEWRFRGLKFGCKYPKSASLRHYVLSQFASSTVRSCFRPQELIRTYRKKLYQKTRVRAIANQYTRNMAFSSSNTLRLYALNWQKAWKASYVTMAVRTYLNFLGNDLGVFSYEDWGCFTLPRTYTEGKVQRMARFKLQSLLRHYIEVSYRQLLHLGRCYGLTITRRWGARHHVYWNFSSNRLFINLNNVKLQQRNYISLSLGLFLKFFKTKKSFKKHKVVKVLLVRFLRKILIASAIRDVYLNIMRTPNFLLELFTALMTPVITPFSLYPGRGIYNDVKQNRRKSPFLIRAIWFRSPKPYGYVKGPKKGRLKRKITRRIIRMNNIMD